mgnify:CR=1 FL=1
MSTAVRSRVFKISAAAVTAAIAIGLCLFSQDDVSASIKERRVERLNAQIENVYTDEYQQMMDTEIADERDAKERTVDSIYTKVNPYGTNTTSMYVYFTTDQASTVSYTVSAEGYPDYTANAITSGQWLGEYDYLTLSKSMFFAVWLALLNKLHLPYLLGGALLWCAAALLAAFALRPLWRKSPAGQARALTLLLYALLAFLPSSWASYTLRVYRDNIFPALCLLFFAGMAGAALRAVFYTRQQAPIWPWLLAAGVGLACGYLNREDAGLFLLPFAIAATLCMLVVLLHRRRWLCAAAQVIPYAVLAAGVGIFCALNQHWYGVWGLSDFSEGSFADAMGAMTRVATDSDEPLLSVPADAREKLYAEIPQLQCLQYWLEEDPQLQNDFRDPELDDYRAGSFYWAIRRAAQYEGIYADAATADAYWQSVADAINAACDNGTLPARSGRRSATSQPIRAQYVLPAIREAAKSALWALTFQDCPAYYQTLRSIGTTEDVAQWSAYLHCNFNNAAEAGKDTPYYAPLQKLAYRALGVLRCVYAVLLPLAFVWAVVRHLCALPMVLRRRTAGAALPWLLLFGLLAMAALRCGMIAFVEVSSFGIGTSTMYLSTVHPLLLLYTYGCLIYYRNKGVITE